MVFQGNSARVRTGHMISTILVFDPINCVKFRLLDLVKSIKLQRNCSNPVAVNVCKRRLMTCCHVCTCSRFGLSLSPNHHLSCVIIDQSPYREIYHTYRYYLRAHFEQVEILSGILYIYCIYARTTMIPPRVLASGPKPCGSN